MKIYGDLLYSLYLEYGNRKVVLTQIQNEIRVPYDRLKTYIAELVELGLVDDETSLKLTQKGIQYLREYENVLDFMKRMGVSFR